MKDLSVTLQEKISVVEACLKQTYVGIYNQEINLRVAKKAEDDEMKKRAVAELKKQEKMKDSYEEILKELKALQKKEENDGTNQSGTDSKEET